MAILVAHWSDWCCRISMIIPSGCHAVTVALSLALVLGQGVQRSFPPRFIRACVRLQLAALGEAEGSVLAAAGSVDYSTMLDVPPEAFPLFISARKFLSMLDGSLPEPYLPRCVTVWRSIEFLIISASSIYAG